MAEIQVQVQCMLYFNINLNIPCLCFALDIWVFDNALCEKKRVIVECHFQISMCSRHAPQRLGIATRVGRFAFVVGNCSPKCKSLPCMQIDYTVRHIKTPQHRAACKVAGLDVIIVFPLAFAIAAQGGAPILQEGYFGMGSVARFDGHGHMCLF